MTIKSSSEELKNMIQSLPKQPGAADMAGEISTLQAIWEDYNKLLKPMCQTLSSKGILIYALSQNSMRPT